MRRAKWALDTLSLSLSLSLSLQSTCEHWPLEWNFCPSRSDPEPEPNGQRCIPRCQFCSFFFFFLLSFHCRPVGSTLFPLTAICLYSFWQFSLSSERKGEGERVIVTHEKSIDTDERSQVKGKKAEKKWPLTTVFDGVVVITSTGLRVEREGKSESNCGHSSFIPRTCGPVWLNIRERERERERESITVLTCDCKCI